MDSPPKFSGLLGLTRTVVTFRRTVLAARAVARGRNAYLALLATWLAAAVAGGAERPNILFIFTDDHAPHAIGAYGSKINQTPNIDRLAREGMIFLNSFCTNSICGPSRAVILTGRHSHLNGLMTNRDSFDGSQVTFPKLLQRSGYQTALVGKWHLKTAPTGFDFWEVLIGQGPYYNPPMRTANGMHEYVGYTTDIITDIALDWLKEKRDPNKPFLLMFQHKAPHREWEPGPKQLTLFDDITIPEPPTLFDDYANRTSAAKEQTMTIAEHLTERDLKFVTPDNLTAEQLATWEAAYGPKNQAFLKAKLEGKELVRWKYQRYIKDYLRCIASVDENIGRVLAYLDETGLAKNTVIVYSSDQGFYLGDHGWFDKRWMYEESLRMPLIVRWPGVVSPGSTDRHLVQNLDYAQTFLEIAGVEAPAEMQGQSLLPLLKGDGPSEWRKSIYYHYYEYPGWHSVQRHYGVRTERYKLIKYYTIGEWELFDLAKDPLELKSVHNDQVYASTRRELEAELLRLQRLYKDTDPEKPSPKISQKELRWYANQEKLRQVLELDQPDGEIPQGLDPTTKPLTVGAWCTPESGDGVLVAHGGKSEGYSLYLAAGIPCFAVRSYGEVKEVRGPAVLPTGTAFHLAGVLTAEGRIQLWVGGKQVAETEGLIIGQRPDEPLSIGTDLESPVGKYDSPALFRGALRDIRLYWGVLDAASLKEWTQR